MTLTEKSNDFKITFGLWEPYGQWSKSSGFKFECFSSTFVPSDYPTQLCGDIFVLTSPFFFPFSLFARLFDFKIMLTKGMTTGVGVGVGSGGGE